MSVENDDTSDIIRVVTDSNETNETDEMLDQIQESEDSDISEGGGDDMLSKVDDESLDYDKSRGVFQKKYDGVPIDKIFADKQVNDDRVQFQGVPIDPNKGMTSSIVFNEFGEMEGITIAVSDKDMIIKLSYKDAYGKLVTINDISPYMMANLGRGMTLAEAQSNFPVPVSQQYSRDPSGTASSGVFPFLLRYDDVVKGNLTDDEAANTINDRWFVVSYEPRIPIRYSYFTLDVFNTNTLTTKYVHYVEVRKKVFHELDDVEEDKDIEDVIDQSPIEDQPTVYVKEEEDARQKQDKGVVKEG